MSRHAGKPRRKPCRARDRSYDSDRQTLALQDRTLLDVELDIGQQFVSGACGRADMFGVEAKRDKRLPH
jgi:hypothetical protein